MKHGLQLTDRRRFKIFCLTISTLKRECVMGNYVNFKSRLVNIFTTIFKIRKLLVILFQERRRDLHQKGSLGKIANFPLDARGSIRSQLAVRDFNEGPSRTLMREFPATCRVPANPRMVTGSRRLLLQHITRTLKRKVRTKKITC